jgi:hypothetical protein
MDEKLPQIAIPPFAHPKQACFAPGGVLPWYQPQPRRKLAPILAMGGVTDRSDERRGRQGPNAWHSAQALTDRMGLADGHNLLVIIRETLVQGTELLIELCKEFPTQCGQFRTLRLQGRCEGVPKFGHPLRQDKAVFAPSPAYFMHQRRPGFDDPLACPVQRLEVLLVDFLHRDKAHRWPCDRFTDRFGIRGIVLIRLQSGSRAPLL